MKNLKSLNIALVVATTALVLGSINIFTNISFAAGSGGHSCIPNVPKNICTGGGGSNPSQTCTGGDISDCTNTHYGSGGRR